MHRFTVVVIHSLLVLAIGMPSPALGVEPLPRFKNTSFSTELFKEQTLALAATRHLHSLNNIRSGESFLKIRTIRHAQSVGTWIMGTGLLFVAMASATKQLTVWNISESDWLIGLGVFWIYQAIVHEGLGHEHLQDWNSRSRSRILLEMFLMQGPPIGRMTRDSILKGPAFAAFGASYALLAQVTLACYGIFYIPFLIAASAAIVTAVIDLLKLPDFDGWHAAKLRSIEKQAA